MSFYSGFRGSYVRAGRMLLPTDLAGLAGWWHSESGHWQDAAGTVSAGAGDPCRRWDDASGAGRHLLAPGDDQRPVLMSAEIDHLPRLMVVGDGVDDRMENVAVGELLAGDDTSCAWLCVMRRPAVGTQTLCAAASGVSNNPYFDLRTGANRLEVVRRDDAATAVTVQGAIPLDTETHVVAMRFAGAAVTILEDRTVKADGVTADVGAMTVTRWGILAVPRLTPIQHATCRIGEVAVWQPAPALDDLIIQLHGMAGRWRIAL